MTDKTYQAVVIGAGAAGLTAAGTLGSLGVHTALIEREALGGDCTWTGCMPSKALLKVAKIAHAVRHAGQYGVLSAPPTVDFARVKAYVRDVVAEIYQHETPQAFSAKYGIEVILGDARFMDAHTLQVGDDRLHAKRIVIATGARATIPPIVGLADVPYLTNKTLWDLDALPNHLLIIGGGAMGAEMAQAFARLGAQVTLIDDDIFKAYEPEARAVMTQIFADEGIVISHSQANKAWYDSKKCHIETANGGVFDGDALLLATGRTPNLDLGLEQAGVQYGADGIFTDDFLRTNIRHIYAVGDCTTGAKYTHYASFQGGIAGRNALLPIKSKGHDSAIPHVTFTEPEVAQVGMTEADARAQFGEAVKIFVQPMKMGDRAVCEGDTEGFIKLVYKGSGTLLGATIVCERAGEMILEFTLAIKQKVTLNQLNTVLHAYPTYTEMSKRAILGLTSSELLNSTTGKVLKALAKRLI